MCYCFPGETKVVTKQGVKRMDELQYGDKILTLNKNGTPTWTKFYAWCHRELKEVAEFLVIKLSNGQQLKISRSHLLFVVGNEGKKVAKTADQVCTGDKLFCLGETESMELVSVEEIRTQTLAGIYAPLTMSGHFLANGFLVGCYANVGQDFELAHAALAPLRTWYRFRKPQTKGGSPLDGIHGYAKKLIKVREFIRRKVYSVSTTRLG